MKFTGASNKGNAMNACVRVLVTMKFTGVSNSVIRILTLIGF